MGNVTLDLLKAINLNLHEHRWTEEDLAQLLTPAFGTISSFHGLRRDLAAILRKDLGDMPPAPAATEHGA
jgi:hypothetical protein